MPIYQCSKCIPTNVPDDWTVEKKTEIGSLVRKYGKIQSVFYFKPTSMKLIDAKGIAAHVTLKKGFCICETELSENEQQCPKCKRLNLDW